MLQVIFWEKFLRYPPIHPGELYSPDRKLFWASSRAAMVSTHVILMLAEDACSAKRSADPRDHSTNLQGSPSTLSCIAR